MNESTRRAKIAVAGITVAALGFAALCGAAIVYIKTATITGTELIFEINDDSVTAHDFVEPVRQRSQELFWTKVTVFGERKLSVVFAEQEGAKDQLVQMLNRESGDLRFSIVANPQDHASQIATAKAQANSENKQERSRRSVVDDLGIEVARWATIGREPMDPVLNVRPFRINPAGLIVRDANTGAIIEFPRAVQSQSPAGVAKWASGLGIKGIDVLMISDSLLDVTGHDLSHVASTFDQSGNAAVAFTLKDSGGKKFLALTTNNSPIGNRQRQLGIVLNDELLSAPNILQPIRKEGRITGNFQQHEVDEIVRCSQARPDAGKIRPTSKRVESRSAAIQK